MSTFKLNLPEPEKGNSIAQAFGLSNSKEKEIIRVFNNAGKRDETKSASLKYITEHDNIRTLEELVYAVFEYGRLSQYLEGSEPSKEKRGIGGWLGDLLGNLEDRGKKSSRSSISVIEIGSDGVKINGKPLKDE